MGLEVYYPEDIRNALFAAEQAMSAATQAMGEQDDPFAAGYRAGYRAALTTIAVAFGLAGGERERQEILCPSGMLALSQGR